MRCVVALCIFLLLAIGCSTESSSTELLPVPVKAWDMMKAFDDDAILAYERYAGKYVLTTIIAGYSYIASDRAVTINIFAPFGLDFTCLYDSKNGTSQRKLESFLGGDKLESLSYHELAQGERAYGSPNDVTVAGVVMGLDDQYSIDEDGEDRHSIVISECKVQNH